MNRSSSSLEALGAQAFALRLDLEAPPKEEAQGS